MNQRAKRKLIISNYQALGEVVIKYEAEAMFRFFDQIVISDQVWYQWNRAAKSGSIPKNRLAIASSYFSRVFGEAVVVVPTSGFADYLEVSSNQENYPIDFSDFEIEATISILEKELDRGAERFVLVAGEGREFDAYKELQGVTLFTPAELEENLSPHG